MQTSDPTPGNPGGPDGGEGDPARGLLLGLLAAQAGLVGREPLLDAARAWTGDRSLDLGEILRERGAIDGRRLELLRALACAALDQNGGDPARVIAALDPPGSTLLALRQIADLDIQATLTDVDPGRPPAEGPGLGTTLDAPPRGPTDRGPSWGRRGRYRIVEFHAAGGLGKVSVATDDELDRRIALKEIRDELADDPACRASFVYEAEVTGQLDHPGVVPVYGFGRDGRPYYAMRFIRGETLEAAVVAFHGPGGPTGRGPRTLALRGLLRRFLDVANAVGYAHSRGVIHRDLKPKNIMLGPHGETLVVDWGLAKPVGRAEGAAAEETIRPSSGGGYAASRYGSVKGTPAYMSPEQAEGRVDELTAAVDVYALGAMLYELIVGRRAFPGRDQDAILARVRAGNFDPPRRVASTVPRPLEAICLKAMAPRPEGRYDSAHSMAEDVERWLADEPVSAYREPPPARAARWLRHHRTAAVASVVLLAATAVGLAVDDVRVTRERAATNAALNLAEAEGARAASERDRAEAERKAAIAARNRANAGFRLARGAVDEIEAVVAGPTLTAGPEEDRLRHRLAEVSLGFYERLLASSPNDAQVRFAAARVAREAADLGRMIDQYDEPLKHYRRAIALLGGLRARSPDDPAPRIELARALDDFGEFYRMNGKLRPAEESFRRAIEVLAPPSGRADAEPARRRMSSLVRIDLASILATLGRYDESRRLAGEAIGALRPGARDEDSAMLLVMARATRGAAARDAGDAPAAEDDLEAAARGARDLLTRSPENRDYQFFLASALDEQGLLLAAGPSRRDLAAHAFDEAVGLLESLARRFPHIRFYARELAVALDGRGAIGIDAGRLGPAAEDCRKARDLLDGLLKARDLPADHGLLGRALGHLARLEADRAGATRLLEQAIAHQKIALAGNPDSPIDKERLGRHEADLAALRGGSRR